MKTQQKIIVGGLAVIILSIASTLFYSSLISEQIKEIAIERAEETNAGHIASLVKKELTKEDFDTQDLDKKQSLFSNFFEHMKSDEIIRIKVWSQDGTIIYSDDKSIVGKNFQNNDRFQQSINGQVTSEIKEPIDPENISEMGYEQLIEIYIPIWIDSSEPVGVVELYCTLDSINESIEKVNFLVFQITLILMVIISLGIIVFAIGAGRISVKAVEQEKFVVMGQLSARVAHDLRNPLSVIKNVATLEELSPSKTKEESSKRKKMVISAIDRMTHQINGVMNFVKTEALELEDSSVKTILGSVKNSISIPNEIQIIYEGNDFTIKCDVKLMDALFSNLISNAIFAMKGKGIIRIEKIDEKDKVILKIIDEGPGIQKEDLKKIFKPLFTTKQEGTGLGLFSCKSIVEQHQGTISVSNNPTTFTIVLPKSLTVSRE